MPDISSLLGSLPGYQNTQPGIPGLMTSAGAPNMPQMTPPPSMTPPTPPSLWDRIQSRLMPSPQGAEGLLSPADLHSARSRGLLDFGLSLLANSSGTNGGNAPAFGQALAGGVNQMRQSYEGTLDSTLSNRSRMQTMQQQQTVLRGRQAIGKFLSENMTGDRTNDFAALRKAYMMSAAIGDSDTMKALSPLLEKDPGLTPRNPLQVSAGGDTVLIDPTTLKPLADVKHTPLPIDPSVLEERQQRIQMAIAEAQARGDARAAQRLNAQLQHENSFVDNYRQDPDIKYGTAVAQVAGQLGVLRDRAVMGDPFAQYQAIEAALRLRNPEMNRQPNPSDYAALANAVGLVGAMKKKLEKYQQGSILPGDLMRKLYATSDNMVRQGRDRYAASRQHFLSRLPVWGLDPALIPDAFESVNVPRETGRTNPLMNGEPK